MERWSNNSYVYVTIFLFLLLLLLNILYGEPAMHGNVMDPVKSEKRPEDLNHVAKHENQSANGPTGHYADDSQSQMGQTQSQSNESHEANGAGACLAHYLCRGCENVSDFQRSPPPNNECTDLRSTLRDAGIVDDTDFCVSKEFCGSSLHTAIKKGAFEFGVGISRVWLDLGADWTTFTSRCHWPQLTWPHGQTCKEFIDSTDVASIAIDANKEYSPKLDALPRVIPVSTAVGLRNSVAKFNHFKGPGCSSMNEPNLDATQSLGANAVPCTQIDHTEIIPVIRLDFVLDLIPSHINIEFVKVDIQGMDLQAVQSMGENLHRVRKVYIEAQDEGFEPLTDGQYSKNQVMKWFKDQGFIYNQAQSALENPDVGEWNLMFDNPKWN